MDSNSLTSADPSGCVVCIVNSRARPTDRRCRVTTFTGAWLADKMFQTVYYLCHYYVHTRWAIGRCSIKRYENDSIAIIYLA